jgi:hypothetical protein
MPRAARCATEGIGQRAPSRWDPRGSSIGRRCMARPQVRSMLHPLPNSACTRWNAQPMRPCHATLWPRQGPAFLARARRSTSGHGECCRWACLWLSFFRAALQTAANLPMLSAAQQPSVRPRILTGVCVRMREISIAQTNRFAHDLTVTAEHGRVERELGREHHDKGVPEWRQTHRRRSAGCLRDACTIRGTPCGSRTPAR